MCKFRRCYRACLVFGAISVKQVEAYSILSIKYKILGLLNHQKVTNKIRHEENVTKYSLRCC